VSNRRCVALALAVVACSSDGAGGAPAGEGGANGTGGSSGAPAYGNPIEGIGLDGGRAVELVQGGFGRIEGPAWLDGSLYFSDIPNDQIRKMDSSGAFSVFRDPSGDSNGIAVDERGLLVVCEQANHRLTRTLADGTVSVVVSDWQGHPFNSPNDLAVKKDGTIYFGDPGFDVPAPPNAPAFHGVYAVDSTGTATLVSDVFDHPNGITLSVDERFLYVSDTLKYTVHRIELMGDGTFGAPELFANTEPIVDGMCIDDANNLYVTTGHSVQVFAKDGTLLGAIPVPQTPANCAFGGPERKTLFITEQANLYEVEVGIPGKPY
jgi:gluconolactonase